MRIPLATYRLQFNSQFDFEQALKILQYLCDLGISDIYASPVLKAKSGSPHGYDLVDPFVINPQLGGQDGFENLVVQAALKGLGWVQDIVPNHMSFDSENPYLMDVFENAGLSKYRGYFDIEWSHPYENLNGKALAPFLGELYGTCLDSAQIKLKLDQAGFFLTYFDFTFPVRIDDYPAILKRGLSSLDEKAVREEPFLKFSDLIRSFEDAQGLTDPQERYKEASGNKSSLWKFYQEEDLIRGYIEKLLKDINGEKGNPDSMNELDALLSRQNFRFSFWKVGNDELNYRRFFTINGLISVKIEKEEVFDFIHSLIIRLVREGKVTGLRIDHFDGLYSPLEYTGRLRKDLADTYIVCEKILDLFEGLPSQAPLQGTTGYDFLNFTNSIFIEKKNEKNFNRVYSGFIQGSMNYQELLRAKKRLFMREYMAGDIDNLARPLISLLGKSRYGKDLTIYALKRAIVEMLAHFPVYRTYRSGENIFQQDEAYIKEAAAGSKNNNPGLFNELEIIQRILLFNYGNPIPSQEKEEWLNFTGRFQQLSSAVMAKGLEDTFFYIYNRFLSLNEVGGNPSVFGLSVGDFHDFNIRRLAHWPHTMNASATHDTKIGEDVHSRLNVLSEIPREWGVVLREFSRINESKKKKNNRHAFPERNDEYRIYQILLGAFPFFEHEIPEFGERMKNYIIKAVKEAKVHTNWLSPDLVYEEACADFVKAILDSAGFLNAFLPFFNKVAFYGIFNSLSAVLLKISSPGLPDFYQGNELWDFSLVDPDNRRLVNYEKRQGFLSDIMDKEKKDPKKLVIELFDSRHDGRLKLFLIYKLLTARKANHEIFQQGTYLPLKTAGKFKDHVVAFLREFKEKQAVVVAPRFLTGVILPPSLPTGGAVWQDTFLLLPKNNVKTWRNTVTGETIAGVQKLSIGSIFNLFPSALLISE